MRETNFSGGSIYAAGACYSTPGEAFRVWLLRGPSCFVREPDKLISSPSFTLMESYFWLCKEGATFVSVSPGKELSHTS